MKLNDLLQLYLKSLQGRASYHCTRRRIRQLFDDLRHLSVHDLTPLQILTWHQGLSSTPHHANRALGILRAAIRWGMPLGLTRHDPTIGIKRHYVESRSRYLTDEEVRLIFHHLPRYTPKFRVYITMLLLTGCRRGEARLARWEHIDFAKRLWRKPRTKAGRWHIVPLPEQAARELLSLPRISPWTFPGMNGQPWSSSGIEKAWCQFRADVGLRDVRIHDLRRTAASHLVIHGENLSTVQQMLDHTSLQPTAVYARLNVDALARALQANADRFLTLSTL